MRKKIILLFSLLVLFCSSCILEPNDENEDNFKYPLEIGNNWEYEHESDLYYYTDTSDTKIYSDTTSEHSNISVFVAEKVDLKNYSDLYKVVAKEYTGVDTLEAITYYKNREDGLYSYAYTGAQVDILLKSTKKQGINFKGLYFKNFYKLSKYIQSITPSYRAQSDSITFEDTPIKSIPYPIKIGAEWTYRSSGNPFRIDKKIKEKDRIDVELGNFECYKIKWIYDINEDGEWDDDIWMIDYISSRGLVQREIHYLGMNKVNEYGEAIGKVDGVDTYTLTDYDIK